MKISIIIPIYKVEKYIEQCVWSILNQTYREIEVILVDDGSPDKCPTICDDFAQKDARIKVIHKPNGGLSDARNVGTAIATGEYILYLDSDDFWASTEDLEFLVNEIKKTPECDFIGFNVCDYYEKGNNTIQWIKYNNDILNSVTPDKCIHKLVEEGVVPISAWSKIIKREIVQNKIQFIKGIYCEDIPWFIELLQNSKKCRYVNRYVYMYRKGLTTSISGSFSYKKFKDLFNLLKNGIEINKKETNTQTRNALFSFWAYELCILRAMTGFIDIEQRKKELQELYKYDWLLEYKLHPKVKKVAFVQKVFGKFITNHILHRYLRTRLA